MIETSACASYPVSPEALPWMPVGPGESVKLLCVFRDGLGRALLLRLEPGCVVPRHRHLGDVHALNLAGTRELIETGALVRAGDYVYEPAGNVDSWRVVGDEPLVVHIVAHGAMEYLDEHDAVTRRDTGASLLDAYRRHCADNGLVARDLQAPSARR